MNAPFDHESAPSADNLDTPEGFLPRGYPTGRLLQALDETVRGINLVAHGVSMAVLFGLMCLTTFDVIGRSFMQSPIPGAFELTGVGLLVIVYFSMGFTQLSDDHISVNFLTAKLPRPLRLGLHLMFTSAMLAITLIAAWQLFLYSNRLANQTTGDLPIPLSVLALITSGGMLLFATTLALGIFISATRLVHKQ